MKKQIFCALMCFTVFSVFAQPILKNPSFENWDDKFGKKYPNGWTCDSFYISNEYVKRVSPGSQGTYALQVGSYFFNGQTWGAELELIDSLTSLPGSLVFEYKEFNNSNPFLNGLAVKIYLYDSAFDYINDVSWYSDGNKSGFTTITKALSYAASPKPVYVRIFIEYLNFGGNTNEYAIIDNLRFLKPVSGIASVALPKFGVYPNPGCERISIENPGSQPISRVQMVSPDGKTLDLLLQDGQLDVSAIDAGIYTLVFLDEKGMALGREVLRIVH